MKVPPAKTKLVSRSKVIAMIVVVVLVASALVAGYYAGRSSAQEQELEECQHTVMGFKDRGPLEELTAYDAKCIEMLKTDNPQ